MGGKEATGEHDTGELNYPKVSDYKQKIASIDNFSFERKDSPENSLEMMLHQHEAWAKSFDTPNAPVRGKRGIFSNKIFVNQDFSGRDLRAADFRFSDLSGANFSGANLTLVDFSGANVENANFTGAVMIKTTFRDTVTDGANFSGIVENY